MRERRRGVAGSTAGTLQRRRRRKKGEGRRSGTLPGSTGGPEVGCSTFLSLMVEEERRKK